MINVAINGFGRIGRMVFRACDFKKINIVGINDLSSTDNLAYLLKYDSAHKKFNMDIKYKKDALLINGKTIKVFSQREPSLIPWGKLNVDVVIESTGVFRTKESIMKHIQAGAKRVLLSAPPKDNVKTIVMGVNDKDIKKNDVLLSNASCTTNCLAPIAKILEDNYGIKNAFMTTTHAYTADQRLVDSPHSDFRRGRSAAMNIIPTSTGATKSVAEVIPSLKDKMSGLALRVPVVTGSIVDFVALVNKRVDKEELKSVFIRNTKGTMKGILEFSEDKIVSGDIIDNPASSIIDWEFCSVSGNLIKIVSWYDNEWGYSNRMIDIVKKWCN
jgi:glyceraldehyde 3-phosphate dehydrogenase